MSTNPLDLDLAHHSRNANSYRLALEVGNYRAALREAIRAQRREPEPAWVTRLNTRRLNARSCAHAVAIALREGLLV